MNQQIIERFDPFFAWIYNHDEKIIGAGFLIGDKEIVTCAHVVRDVLRLRFTPYDAPEADIVLSFPFLQQGRRLLATVVAEGWDKEKDIAVLQVNIGLPEGAHPAILSALRVDKLENHPFCVYGFPGVIGVWADGVIKKKREHGQVQLESASLIGYAVQGGFSGGPVFDKELKKVVGMIVTSDESARVASMTPVDMLASVCNKTGVTLELTIDKENGKRSMNIHPREICEKCLKKSFTARDKDEFISLFMNEIPDVGRQLDETRSIDWMINKVLDHIFNTKEFEKLRIIMEKYRKNQYEEFHKEWKNFCS